MLLLVLKLTLAPGLVAGTTLAGRRWGPQVAGWLGGLPVVVGPILLALALEHGEAFAADAASGALLGLLALNAFALAYAWAARATSWLPSLAAGWATACCVTLALEPVRVSVVSGLAAACVAALAAERLLPQSRAEPSLPPPRWDLALRTGATAALVLLLTGLADALGSQLSGMLAAFPVLASVLATFTHAQDGAAAVASLLRGMVRGLLSFAAFCFVVALMLESAGIAATFGAATATALAAHAVLRVRPRAVARAPRSA